MLMESTKVELKKSLATQEEIMETICAFSNSEGGKLYIGVEDDGKVVGLSIGKNTLVNLANDIARSITPPIYPVISETIIEDKQTIEIGVHKSEHQPNFYKGRAFKRIGKMNKIVDPINLELMFRQKFLEKTKIDSEPTDANKEDIDEKSVKAFTSLAGKQYAGLEHSLKNLGLIKKENILNAAILFFGKEPNKFFPLYGVKLASFRQEEMQDLKEYNGNLLAIVEPVIEYIAEKIPRKLYFDKASRYEKPLIPKEVIREAIVNALIHRDYAVSSSVFVKITQNEVEIKNPGILPAPLEISDLYRPHQSLPRNPLLAELANKAKMIEHWGSGTLRIIEGMRKAGLEDPKFIQKSGYFSVVLPIREIALSKRQQKMLNHVKASGHTSFQELIKVTKTSKRTAARDVDELVKKGLLFKTKKGRTITYHTTR